MKSVKNFSRLRQKYLRTYGITLKTSEQIEGIRKACQFVKTVMDEVVKKAKEGVTTNELNALCEELFEKAGAKSAALHYGSPPYPKSACFSLNEVICHGIANDEPLKKGDILNIDIAAIVDGYYGDTSTMALIHPISEEKQRVVDAARDCLSASIAILQPGVHLSAIGDAIEKIAAERNCSVVNQFVGHGVGLRFHEPPQVCHHYNEDHLPLAPGMIFTIEPMINAGEREGVIDPYDQWTVRTIDKKPSAQFEHTVLITPSGYEVLTG